MHVRRVLVICHRMSMRGTVPRDLGVAVSVAVAMVSVRRDAVPLDERWTRGLEISKNPAALSNPMPLQSRERSPSP